METPAHSAIGAVTQALESIDRVDAAIQAWVRLDRNGALEAAAELDQRPGDEHLPLRGIPVGIKDIIDVTGMVTTFGCGSWAHRMATEDAPIVRKLRDAGAVIIGKTATTEFAYADPAPTRNPWNLAHTPGGSSSGSAAAVAAGMVPVAIGTQTVGSVLRPAAYCGVVGFKPGYGWMSTEGIAALAWSFDHPGIFARTVAEVARVFAALVSEPGTTAEASTKRLAVPRVFFEQRSQPALLQHFDAVAARLSSEVGDLIETSFPSRDEWFAPGTLVLATEAAAYHQLTFPGHEDDHRPNLKALLEQGRGIAATDYVRAKRTLADYRERVLELLESNDALLLPVAPGPAPAGLTSTGDSSFCAPASWTGLPAIALPTGVGEDGLPLAVQLIGQPGGEAALLSLASRVASVFEFWSHHSVPNHTT